MLGLLPMRGQDQSGSCRRPGLLRVLAALLPATIIGLFLMAGISPDPALAASPHGGATGQSTCSVCHALHAASTEGSLMKGGTSAEGEVPTCLICHDGTGATGNVQSGSDSFGSGSGHRLEDVTELAMPRDLTNSCSDCHSPHGDPVLRPRLPAESVNGTSVAGTGTAWCFACHNDAQDWYDAIGIYPSLSDPSRDATGYPIAGTYAGQTVYVDSTVSAHAGIPAAGDRVQGDCLYCHHAHGSANGYDALNADFRPSTPATVLGDRIGGTYAAACFQCHDGTLAGVTDIKRFVVHEAGDETPVASGGHRIKSEGGTLPPEAPLPCYDCHNPHGSSRGNAKLLSDELGEGLSTADATSVRQFCLSCHVTYEVTGWDSDANDYVDLAASTDRVEGLLRNGGGFGDPDHPDGGFNWLRLKQTSGHYEADSQSCYECHGNDYSAADKNNVHDPGSYSSALHTATVADATITIRGVAYTGQVCADCHDMELGPEHAEASSSSSTEACGACHPDPRASVPDWGNDTCAEGDCHAGSATAIMHAEVDADHVSPAVSCTASGCHEENGLAAVHDDGNPATDDCAHCHAAGVPTTSDCATCHGFSEHPPHTVSGPCASANCHATDAATIHGQPGGPGCDACHADGVTETFACRACHASPHPNSATVNHGPATDQCYSCHATSNVMGVHGDDCDSCHPSPAGPTAVYAGGCEQAGCHPGVHDGTHESQNHGDGADCWRCHDVSEWACQGAGCHSGSYERAKPVTNSDAVAAYTGYAVIVLSPVDQGDAYYTSGVKSTYFQIDGQELQTGQFVLVPGPATGTKNHTLEYWSVDNHYNVETHHIVYFSVTAGPPDTTPPSGVMSVNNGAAYTRTSATVNSSVAGCDAGMRVDPGTGVYGPWIPYADTYAITLPWSNGVKTVRVEYRDGANNILAVTDTITVDITAPSITLAISGGSTYTRTLDVSLSVTGSDGGSGLNQMRFSTNGSTWTAWEPWATTKAFTLSSGTPGTRYAYIQVSDFVGNTTQVWDNIYYDAVLPAGSMSINEGAVYTLSTSVTLNSVVSDAHSNMSQMRFSNDGVTWSAWETYAATKPWTLTAGDGTKIVYAQYSDRAGNVLQVSDAIVLGGVTDFESPTGSILINNDAPWVNTTSVTLNLSAIDNVGGSGVWDMRFSNDNVSFSAWEVYAATKAWTMGGSGASRTVYVQYRDAAGNISSTYSDSIGFETLRPSATVISNGGDYFTASQTVTLSVSGSDGMGGSGVTHMQFSNDGINWSAWQAYATSTSWTLSAGAGHKTVYVQVRDAAGNVSWPASDFIAYNVYHTLTYTAGANGTVTGASPQTVQYGGSGTQVTAVPNTGYKFIGWSDGTTANPRTDSFVTGDVNATAWFTPTSYYVVQFLTDGYGYVDGQWIQGVPSGGSTTPVTAYPHDPGAYYFTSWYDGGSTWLGTQTLTRTNVTGNQTWTAQFTSSGTCPFLYTWDGDTYQFESDEFAAGYIGLRTSKGYRRPNPLDYHVIETVPTVKDGALEFRLVEERDETDYIDQAKLYTVDAPADRDVYVERSQAEGVGTFTTLDAVIHTVARELEPPPSVTWINTGQDVRDLLAASDGEYLILNADRNAGYTYQTLELDLGDVQDAPMVKLVMDGRTMIPTSPDGRAYSRTYGPQVKFEVQDAAGKWVAVPASTEILPKPPEFDRPFVLDLTNVWVSDSRKVRLTYLYKTYWDSILLDTTDDAPVTLTELPLLSADLQPHGFNFHAGIGELFEYVYGEAMEPARYRLPGYYTKFGDVTPLLDEIDDMFVIFGGGDEITMRFAVPDDAPANTTRRYLFLSDGYYKTLKEDISKTVEPLPFAAMSNFPYPDTESYPTDAEHEAYRSEWNTRYESD